MFRTRVEFQRVGAVLTVTPGLLRSDAPDRARNVLQIVVETGHVCLTIMVEVGETLLAFKEVCPGLQRTTFL